MSKNVTTKIRCAVSGIVTGCRPDVYAKRLAKAGSAEALASTYVSSFAKRELRAGKSVSAIRASQNMTPEVLNTLPTESALASVIEKVMAKGSAKADKPTSPLASPFGEKVAKDAKAWQKAKGVDADVANFVANK